jgi:hypothetical protein
VRHSGPLPSLFPQCVGNLDISQHATPLRSCPETRAALRNFCNITDSRCVVELTHISDIPRVFVLVGRFGSWQCFRHQIKCMRLTLLCLLGGANLCPQWRQESPVADTSRTHNRHKTKENVQTACQSKTAIPLYRAPSSS